jgi:hypothetical protein
MDRPERSLTHRRDPATLREQRRAAPLLKEEMMSIEPTAIEPKAEDKRVAVDLGTIPTPALIEELEQRIDDEAHEFYQRINEDFLEERAADGLVLVDLDELEKSNDLLWTDPAGFPEQMRTWLRRITGRF